jgi:exopolysaccharide production protein ExoZ
MINNIQALRAFAALNVVIFHTLGVASMKGYETVLFKFLEGWGSNGVDIFFVISGFVMVYIQTKNPKSVFEFLKNRIKRIVPLYWSLTAFLTIIYYFFSTKFSIQHSLNSFLFASRLFGKDLPLISQGWTLEYEMFFYLVFGISIIAKRHNTALISSILLILLVAFGFIAPIVIEFTFGMLVGYLYLNRYFQKYSLLFGIIGCMGLIIGGGFISNISRVLVFGLPATFLVFSCCYLPQTKCRKLSFLGAASYSIYLIQAFTMPIFFDIAKFISIPSNHSDLLIVLCLLFTICAGCYLHYYFESPISRFLK